MARKIIHLDLDAFFCAVEQLANPNLSGKPFAVGGSPTGRGVITSASYEARKMGVRSAMPSSRALRLCPELQLISSQFSRYREYSNRVMELLKNETELIEQISIDEAFMDFSWSSLDIRTIAEKLQKNIMRYTKLPSSLGGATNKLVAKIANNVGKSSRDITGYPNAITIIPPGSEEQFLAPLPCRALWGIGPKTAIKLERYGIRTIGDIANWDSEELRERFGKLGGALYNRSRGIDERALSMGRDTKSISHETTFHRDVTDKAGLLRRIEKHSQSISKRLLKANLIGATVKLKIRWSDFSTITRQQSLLSPTNDKKIISDIAKNLLDSNWKSGTPVRLIGVGVSNLQPPLKQLSLWNVQEIKQENKLSGIINELNKKYGVSTIQTGKDFRNSSKPTP